jgi:hypothetical protein
MRAGDLFRNAPPPVRPDTLGRPRVPLHEMRLRLYRRRGRGPFPLFAMRQDERADGILITSRMPIFQTSLKLLRRYRMIAALVLSVGALYFASWHYRRELGLIHPMANMVYYYYGGKPNGYSDRMFYWIYYPIYRCGDRYGIHWSDRRNSYDPSQF